MDNYTRTLSAFPCGRTQHVRCMRSSIVSVIQFVLEFRFMRAIPHSYISGNISSPFFLVTAYLLESSQAHHPFSNIVALWHLRKPTSVNEGTPAFTDVGHNIGQVEKLLGCINPYQCVF